jgi:hypothetical protein
MSDKYKVKDAKTVEKLKKVQAHVVNVQNAISEGGSGKVAVNDWESVIHLVKEYKEPANNYWTKQGPNAPFIQAIIHAFDSLGNKLPKQDSVVDTNAINTILANIQKQIDHVKPGDQQVSLVELNEALVSVQNIIKAISEGGDEPVSADDMHTLTSLVNLYRVHHWEHKKNPDKHVVKNLIEKFNQLVLDAGGLVESDNLMNTERMNFIERDIQALVNDLIKAA